MNRSLVIKQEDVDLFRQAVGDVAPLRHNTTEPPRSRTQRHTPGTILKDRPRPESNYRDEPVIESMRVSAEDDIEFRISGVQDRVFRKLRQGRFEIAGELDLHGMTVARAKGAFDGFMAADHRYRGRRCVRIIHGKGYRSREGLPVIKHKIQAWLQGRGDVLAYCSCRPGDGGTGALYVLLKSTHG